MGLSCNKLKAKKWGRMLKRVAKLYDRATGGANVAADPNNPLDNFWPRAADAAGIDIASEWFEKAKTRGDQVFLFLVGGPGGGKSHVSAQLVANLEEIDPKETGLARRAHIYRYGTKELLLVNDATIDESDRKNATLKLEIEESLESEHSIIACVNRGILVEELSQFHSASNKLVESILLWISSSDAPDIDTSISTSASSDYVKFGKATTKAGQEIEICVCYVDVCSLFERAPKPSHFLDSAGNLKFDLPDYKIGKFSKRRSIELDDQPATDLFSKAISAIVQGEDIPNTILYNPVAANLKNLSQSDLVISLASVMRSAEICTGQRFTYREIWGAIARSIIGDLSGSTNSFDLETVLVQMQPKAETPREHFRAMQRLADLRYHQALFGLHDGLTVANQHLTNPVTKLMAAVDPIRDSQPGYFDHGDDTSGWVTPLLDAFASSFAAGSPLEAVIKQVENRENDLFTKCITEFDRQLDESFTKLIGDQSLKDAERGAIVRWYSTYLSRLYAISNGISAFREQISTWIQIWTTEPKLPIDIEKKFLSMLRPRRSGSEDESSYIPLFDSRTVSITSRLTNPKLAVRLSDLKTVTRREGDSIILILLEQGQEVAEILLDFSLLRDALVCTADDVGVSDVSNVNAPRLERLRASRLAPSMLSKNPALSVLRGNSSVQIVVTND